MQILIKTRVDGNFVEVSNRFDGKLFEYLSAPFPKLNILHFGGCETGDVVRLELNFLFFKEIWTSVIISRKQSEKGIYFIDEGRELPFFITYWNHKHKIDKISDTESEIVDEIEFQSHNMLFTILSYPFLWLQFYQRKKKYKNYFNHQLG